MTFKLRKDAKFHDGTPVTAKDVKWSFDRAVTVGGFPTFQMKAGSLEKPEQFEVVDDHTFRVKFLRKDKLTMPDLAVPVPVDLSTPKLAKKHATAERPLGAGLAQEQRRRRRRLQDRVLEAGAGDRSTRASTTGRAARCRSCKRVIVREVPSAGNRRALLERGDVDIVVRPAAEGLRRARRRPGKLKVVGVPVENAHVVRGHERDQAALRQPEGAPGRRLRPALREDHATPRCTAAASSCTARRRQADDRDWPQPHRYTTDLAKAKALLAEAGYASGFETTLSFDLGLRHRRASRWRVLIQESLAQIGIKVTINKIPGANWRGALLKKDMPLILNALRRLAELPRVLLLLVLPRPERGVQHHVLPEPRASTS